MEPTDHLFNKAREIRMTDAERSRVRANLLVRMRAHPAGARPSPYMALFSRPMFAGAFVILLMVAIGTGAVLLPANNASQFEPTVEGTRPAFPSTMLKTAPPADSGAVTPTTFTAPMQTLRIQNQEVTADASSTASTTPAATSTKAVPPPAATTTATSTATSSPAAVIESSILDRVERFLGLKDEDQEDSDVATTSTTTKK